MTRSFAVLLVAAVVALPAVARAADADNGKRLAERWCAACHVVSSAQHSGNTQAPPFSEVAKKKHVDAPMLALFLLLPHPKMPDMGLSRAEAADLATYIVSLK
jgi:mono/diheme cytochrome c family protein